MNFEKELVSQMEELGRQVKNAREFRRLSREMVARQADIGVMTLVRIEAGNPAVSVLNLHKVLRVLGLPQSLAPTNLPTADDLPRQAKHLASNDTDEALEQAVSAACSVLDEWLAVKHPERDGISSNFQGQLREHLAAMLCGRPGAVRPVRLKRIVYSDDFLGGPLYVEDPACQGWALRIRGESTVIQDNHVIELKSTGFDPYTSRAFALAALRSFVETEGHPPGPVDAVPVYLDAQERYRFGC